VKNHFVESEEATFSSSQALKFISEIHFPELAENHFTLKKSFGSHEVIILENPLPGTLPNAP
jgi:hypothetical protein